MKRPKRPGPAKGHPGWGGRPKGLEMPCGWGCGAKLSVGVVREHFKTCPNRFVLTLDILKPYGI